MTRRAIVLLFLLALLTSGCLRLDDPALGVPLDQRPVRVVATTGMIADLVQNVGGERVTVRALMGPGVDPHLYRARASDVEAMQRADIIFYNGLHLEGKMVELFEKMALRRPTVAVADAVPAERLRQPIEFEGAYDPHIWFDVGLWRYTVAAVEEALSALDPASAPLYRANAERYRAELDALDAYVRDTLARIPPERRVLITAHDAFGYFGIAYGVEVRGLQGTSTAAEAGPADVQNLADFISARGVRAIFVESSVSPRTIEAVQAAVRARGHAVAIGGQLYADALGPAGSPEGAYLGMVRYNVDTIVAALQ
jgi:manganese/zinc/iron transport system substrate-binding protein